MVKKWELKIRKRKKEKPVSITESELRSPTYSTSSLLPPPFVHSEIIYPPTSTLENWEKIQHRLISEGRSIAMENHPRRFWRKGLIGDIGDGLETEHHILVDTKVKKSISDLVFKEYRVKWTIEFSISSVGDDPLKVMGVDKNSSNPGGTISQADTILSIDSTFGKYAPDAFVWAVWFRVNSAFNPPDEYWPPYADLYPAWNDYDVGPPFPAAP